LDFYSNDVFSVRVDVLGLMDAQINIKDLKQGDTITFVNGLTALVCNVIHNTQDPNAWRGDYVIHFYVNHPNSPCFEFNSKYYFADGTYRSAYDEWTPSPCNGWFITDIKKAGKE